MPLKPADAIVAVSAETKADILRLFNVAEGRASTSSTTDDGLHMRLSSIPAASES